MPPVIARFRQDLSSDDEDRNEGTSSSSDTTSVPNPVVRRRSSFSSASVSLDSSTSAAPDVGVHAEDPQDTFAPQEVQIPAEVDAAADTQEASLPPAAPITEEMHEAPSLPDSPIIHESHEAPSLPDSPIIHESHEAPSLPDSPIIHESHEAPPLPDSPIIHESREAPPPPVAPAVHETNEASPWPAAPAPHVTSEDPPQPTSGPAAAPVSMYNRIGCAVVSTSNKQNTLTLLRRRLEDPDSCQTSDLESCDAARGAVEQSTRASTSPGQTNAQVGSQFVVPADVLNPATEDNQFVFGLGHEPSPYQWPMERASNCWTTFESPAGKGDARWMRWLLTHAASRGKVYSSVPRSCRSASSSPTAGSDRNDRLLGAKDAEPRRSGASERRATQWVELAGRMAQPSAREVWSRPPTISANLPRHTSGTSSPQMSSRGTASLFARRAGR